MKNLVEIIEGILFLSGKSVFKGEIEERLGVSPMAVDEAVVELKKRHENTGIILVEVESKLQFATNPKFVEEISAVTNPIKEREFSQSMLEVVSIVAYKQPITRLEVEKIRGVSSEYAINALIKQEIIAPVGRKDAVGKPFLFGTTENFLKKFNLKTIDELPAYEDILEKIKNFDDDEEETEMLALEEGDIMNPEFLQGEDIVTVSSR